MSQGIEYVSIHNSPSAGEHFLLGQYEIFIGARSGDATPPMALQCGGVFEAPGTAGPFIHRCVFGELFSEMKDQNMASTTERNPLTGTTMEGCVSNAAKHMLLEVETNRYELDFFEEIKDLFWRRVASHPKRTKLRQSVWMDFP